MQVEGQYQARLHKRRDALAPPPLPRISSGAVLGSLQQPEVLLNSMGIPSPPRECDTLGTPSPPRECDTLGTPSPPRECDTLGTPSPPRECDTLGTPSPPRECQTQQDTRYHIIFFFRLQTLNRLIAMVRGPVGMASLKFEGAAEERPKWSGGRA